MTIEQIISEGLNVHEKNLSTEKKDHKVKKIVQEVGLNYADIYERFPHEFSGGQRQRIAIARALILQPKLLILDEPTFGMGFEQKNQLSKYLREIMSQKHLILISHDIAFIDSHCDHVYDLDKKTVYQNKKVLVNG